MTELAGYCCPQFRNVYDIFQSNLQEGKEVGASLYVNVNGEDVIDFWGGWREREKINPWTEHTIVNVFSASKTVTSLAVLMLVDRGQIDLFAPVAKYWPEFSQGGKENIQVRHLLSHTAGLPAWEPPFSTDDAYDIETSTTRLAAQSAWWEPGTRASYHASTFGHLVSELVRRVTGTSLKQFISQEIASPLGADFYLGLEDEQFSQVATVYPAPEKQQDSTPGTSKPLRPDDHLQTERAISKRTRLGSFSGTKRDRFMVYNSREWRRAEFSGSTGHCSARGLGRIISALSLGGVSRGVRLLSPKTIDLIFQEQANGIDAYYMKPIRWGIGYALASEHDNSRGPLPFLRPGKKTCFWYGTGGALSIADVERRITITYAMNQCRSGRNSLNGVYYNAIQDCL